MADDIVVDEGHGGRLTLSTTGGGLRVSLELPGLSATTEVDGDPRADEGWHHPDPSVVLPPADSRGLVDLLDHVASHLQGWPDEERWESRDGRLILGFRSRPDGLVNIRAVIRQRQPAGWAAYATLKAPRESLLLLRDRARELAAR